MDRECKGIYLLSESYRSRYARATGESDKPDHGYRVYRFAQDLHEALEHLGISSVDLMGALNGLCSDLGLS